MALTREQLEAFERPIIDVPIPEMDDSLCLRMMRADEREEFDEYLRGLKDGDAGLQNAYLVAKCLCNPDGTLMYSPDVAGAADVSTSLFGPILDRLVTEASKLNRMQKEAVEDAAKNSEETADDSSNSD